MGGQEPIRFGLMGYGKNYKVNVRNFDRFAKEGIRLEELKEILSEKNIKIKDEGLFDKMFASIAKDDLLDANELFGYFKQLDKAAELNEKNLMLSDNEILSNTGEELGDILQASELEQMEKVRGHVGKKPNAAQTETMFQFVNALIQKNDEKVQIELQEEAKIATQEAQRAAEAAELASRTTVDPKTGNVKIVDKDNPKNYEIRDKNGKLIQKTYEDEFYYNRETQSFGIDNTMVTEKYDKDEKVIQRVVAGKAYGGERITLVENINPKTGKVRSDKLTVRDSKGNLLRTEERVFTGKPRNYVEEYEYEDESGRTYTEKYEAVFTPYKKIVKDGEGRITSEEEVTADRMSHETSYQYNKDGTTSTVIRNVGDIKHSDTQTDANGQILYETKSTSDGVFVLRYYKDGEAYITLTETKSENGVSTEFLYKNDKISGREYNRLKEQIENYYLNNGLTVGDYFDIYYKDIHGDK